jgi:hypothetical protein
MVSIGTKAASVLDHRLIIDPSFAGTTHMRFVSVYLSSTSLFRQRIVNIKYKDFNLLNSGFENNPLPVILRRSTKLLSVCEKSAKKKSTICSGMVNTIRTP